MSFVTEYGLFFAKAFTILIVFLLALAGVIALTRKSMDKITIESINDELDSLQKDISKTVKKAKPRSLTRKEKRAKREQPCMYVIDFNGDIKASAASALQKVITAILLVAQKKDEIVVRIESPGGTVNGYGLCASQLQRIRDAGIYLTVCIDKVAASGGYLMAAVANQILAAPFAIVGSIGVVAQMPNFHRWLKNHDVDVELFTAGEYKRTVTVFGENSKKGKEKFKEDLEQIHTVFKHHVLRHRPNLNIKKVATGEHWLAIDALDYNLVDHIKTSDDYLTSKRDKFNIYEISAPIKQPFLQKLIKPLTNMLNDRFNF
ncbi:MAG: protease SohB [Legionellales bacterium RIFCSPHIGHO2_12_FULL_37_14]|nr:MAG: protease SohB [Legionellales bacterium RIFCSPHIGHO2_12_FULL_37_14]